MTARLARLVTASALATLGSLGVGLFVVRSHALRRSPVSHAIPSPAPPVLELVESPATAPSLTTSHAPAEIVSEAEFKKVLGGKRGKPVVLHLWATWCAPCLEELPLLGKLAQDWRQQGIEVLSFSLDNPNEEAAAKVAEAIGLRAGNALDKRIVKYDDTDAFISAIDPHWEGTIPALFAFERTGKLAGSLIGESTQDELAALVSKAARR